MIYNMILEGMNATITTIFTLATIGAMFNAASTAIEPVVPEMITEVTVDPAPEIAKLESAVEVEQEQEPPKEEEAEPPLTKNSKNEKMVSDPVQPAPAVNKSTTSNVTGLPDTITRYEWERQGGWAKLVEAAYLRALERGVTPMCGDGMCKTVLYYKITGVATDPCYATLEAVLEVDGETRMEIAGADLIAAPGAICDAVRSQTITVPTLGQLTQYLREVEAKYGRYATIKGSSK